LPENIYVKKVLLIVNDRKKKSEDKFFCEFRGIVFNLTIKVRAKLNCWFCECVFRRSLGGIPAKAYNGAVASFSATNHTPLSVKPKIWYEKHGTSGWATYQRTSEKNE
jgi:hypothetical protein